MRHTDTHGGFHQLNTLILLGAIMSGFSCSFDSTGADMLKPLPSPAKDLPSSAGEGSNTVRTAVFAGGCFWCVEGVFEKLAGVTDVVSGYAGGTAATADYKKVSAGQTDHAEVVQIAYDPGKISYGTLLRVFFATHNPTQLNGQGPDWGRQYRSAVFYGSKEEHDVVAAYIDQLTAAKVFDKPIVTTLERLDKFYPAEDYHQDFVAINPGQGYVRQWALPKIQKLKKLHPDLLKEK